MEPKFFIMDLKFLGKTILILGLFFVALGPDVVSAETEEGVTLEEIQEILDDISERVDILSREVADLLKESQKIPDGIVEEEMVEEEDEYKKKGFFIKTKKEEPEPSFAEASEDREGDKKTKKEKKIQQPVGGGGGGGGSSDAPIYCEKTPEAQPLRDKIVINEIAWMGTDESANNEWIELKNITDSPANLSAWQILDKNDQIKIIFESNNMISGKGFYLLERTDDSSVPDISADFIYKGTLNDNDEALYLFNSGCQLEDEIIADSDWSAGDKNEKRTMERGDDLAWHSYSGDGENGIMGTPKAENSQPSLFQSILEVEPESLEFIIETDSDSQSQIFMVSNIGEGVLEWRGTVNYTSPSEGMSWLVLDPVLGAVSSGASSPVLASLDVSDLDNGVYLSQIIIRAEDTQGSPEEIEVSLNLDIEEVLEDTLPSEVSFNLDPVQNSLSFLISFEIVDKAQEGVTPSGLAGFNFRWKEIDGDWSEEGYREISGVPLSYSEEKEFKGEDGKTYYFQIKARDMAENESIWLSDTPIFTTINIPKKVLINEIQIDSIEGSGGANDDWVELYNPNDIDLSLDNWSIQEHSSSDPCSLDTGFYKKNFPQWAVIPANGFFLIVDTQAEEELKDIADILIGWSLTGGNTVYLVKNQDKIESGDDSDIIDKVGFGQACFSETNPAPDIPEEKSIERRESGLDTDDNSQDFEINDNPSPVNSEGKTTET